MTQASCTGPGVFDNPVVILPRTPGVQYVLDGSITPGSTVTITATATEGYNLPTKTTGGWVLGDGEATLEVQLQDIDCTVEVEPEDPTVKQTSCGEPGVQIPPEVTPATTTGITYSIDGSVAAGETIHVVATPESGYVLTNSTGWVDSGNTKRFEVVLADPDCGGGQSQSSREPVNLPYSPSNRCRGRVFYPGEWGSRGRGCPTPPLEERRSECWGRDILEQGEPVRSEAEAVVTLPRH